MQLDDLHRSVDRDGLAYMQTGPSNLKAMAARAAALSSNFCDVAVAYGEKYRLFHAVGSDEEFEYHARQASALAPPRCICSVHSNAPGVASTKPLFRVTSKDIGRPPAETAHKADSPALSV